MCRSLAGGACSREPGARAGVLLVHRTARMVQARVHALLLCVALQSHGSRGLQSVDAGNAPHAGRTVACVWGNTCMGCARACPCDRPVSEAIARLGSARGSVGAQGEAALFSALSQSLWGANEGRVLPACNATQQRARCSECSSAGTAVNAGVTNPEVGKVVERANRHGSCVGRGFGRARAPCGGCSLAANTGWLPADIGCARNWSSPCPDGSM